MKKSFVIFGEDCMGCHACEVACKQEHDLDVGPQLIRVLEKSPYFIPIYCHHCAKPPCRDACPVDAISRDEAGIVRIAEDVCIGCKACVPACPFGAMQFEERKEVAVKCDLCYDRLQKGQNPACMEACPTRCIVYGDMAAIKEKAIEGLAIE